jgi:hypothetical protein
MKMQDHPRSCGNDLPAATNVGQYVGSPPLVRERLSKTPPRTYPSGITPARAGTTGGWHGRKYQTQCAASYKKNYLQKRYSVDETYFIYISPKNPQVFVINKRIPFTTWLLLCMGFLFLFEIFYFFG